MYEKLEVCPVCKHTDFKNFLICTDHSISGESFALNQCKKCSVVFTNPRPTDSALPKYYDDPDYISHQNQSTNLINCVYKLVRNYTLSKKVKMLKKYSTGTSILDYGCGTGDFLATCKRRGYTTYGYEPNPIAKEQAGTKGIAVVEDIKDIKGDIDIITAWHVLEHVSDLRKTIKLLRKKLSDTGVLLIAVPNLNSYDAAYYKEHWAALDVPRHLYHFTQESFGKLLELNKLTLVNTIPMHFDSYYVSLLSEKYKNQRNNYFRALKTGYTSNQKAKQTGEYSSLIYVIRK